MYLWSTTGFLLKVGFLPQQHPVIKSSDPFRLVHFPIYGFAPGLTSLLLLLLFPFTSHPHTHSSLLSKNVLCAWAKYSSKYKNHCHGNQTKIYALMEYASIYLPMYNIIYHLPIYASNYASIHPLAHHWAGSQSMCSLWPVECELKCHPWAEV